MAPKFSPAVVEGTLSKESVPLSTNNPAELTVMVRVSGVGSSSPFESVQV